jgi:diguanylate cyclase (GGDEF)-like protein
MIDAQKIWSSPQLPTLPTVALRLIELSRSPTTEIADIVAVVKSDPAIVARLLKAANSSFFGLACRIKSIDQAVILLGTTAVTALALGFSLVDTSLSNGPLGATYAAFWLQSTVQATAAKMLAKRQFSANEEDHFLAGLLLDLGRLAMLKTIPRDYAPVVEAATSRQCPLHEAETDLLGINHIEVGFNLMKRWSLPDVLCDAVHWHHEPPAAFSADADSVPDPLVKTTAVASAIGEYFCGAAKGLALERLRRLADAHFKISGPELEIFFQDMRSRIDEIAGMYSVDAQALASSSELLAQANEQLAMLAISAQAESVHAHARQEAAENQIRTLEVKHEQLRQQALRDPLTKLYNRHFFDETLAREVQRCTRDALPLGVIFFDADRFKAINDRLGHTFGDEVLKRIAGVAAATLRVSDVLARYGGEEFVIMIAQPSEKGLAKAAERIRAGVESCEILYQGERIPLTVSLGAAVAIPDRSGNPDGMMLVQAADEAMYQAKQSGRNQVRLRNLMSDFNRQLVAMVLQRRFSRWLVSKGALELPAVSRALLHCQTRRIPLDDLACQTGLLSPAQTGAIRTRQKETGLRFGETAVRMNLLDINRLAGLLAIQHEAPRDLALSLARLGLLDAGRIQMLLDGYESDIGISGSVLVSA